MARIFLSTLLIIFCAASGFGQALAGREDNQSWNELQLTVPMSKRVDFIFQLSERFGDSFVKRPVDHRVGIGFVFKPHKSWTVLPFYLNIDARNALGRFRTEHRLNLRVAYRLPYKKIGITPRVTFEWRRRAPLNSWRIRPAIAFEKDISKIIPKSRLFIIEEGFYDSLGKQFTRNRFSVGVSRTISKKT